jgi:hypothetical protein
MFYFHLCANLTSVIFGHNFIDQTAQNLFNITKISEPFKGCPHKSISLARKFLSTLPCHVEPGLKFFHQVLIKLAITLQENLFSDQQIIETLPTFSFGVKEQFFLGSNIFPLWNIKIRILFFKKENFLF